MKFTRTNLVDVVMIEPDIHGDDRGYFIETFRQDKLEAFLGFSVSFCQDSESKSGYGVLRGLHFQTRVIKGEILDVVVDIRKGSPTFGQHVSTKLSEENKRQLFVPRGFAHGFVVLSESCIFSYKVDNYYNPEYDRGIAFDDPALGIDWLIRTDDLKLSKKDIGQDKLSKSLYV
jgi:dTDP-4-dehydrorhamnose 3,5-epimerase